MKNSAKPFYIKPEYKHIKYSELGDPLLDLADAQLLNDSAYPSDKPVLPVDMKKNGSWAKELRHAAEAK